MIWPFLNAEIGPGPYELFLDINALNQGDWFSQLSDEIRDQCVVNPWPALLEQWVSNAEFRKSPQIEIKKKIEPLLRVGVRFRENFVEDQERLLVKNDRALRTQFSLVVPYVAIMKSLLSPKLEADEALQKLEDFARRDIPRYTASLMLGALTALLKEQQSLRLADDPKPAFSYLRSFLDFQPGKKDEVDHINVPYLRNRAGDLNLWMGLPLLWHSGYQFVGNPAIVTNDKALHRVIVRAIPPVLQETRSTSFSLSQDLPSPLPDRIIAMIKQVQPRTSPSPAEQLTRMTNLFELAKSCCADAREQAALDEVYREWWRPGFGEPLDLS